MGKLEFTRPVSVSTDVSSEYDKWRDVKGKNNKLIGKKQHKGIDYKTPKGTSIQASESGKVIRAAFDPPNEPGGISYGNVIIIGHTPGTGKGKRHIYTLYICAS